jgi:hypothetical protein
MQNRLQRGNPKRIQQQSKRLYFREETKPQQTTQDKFPSVHDTELQKQAKKDFVR